MHTANLDECLYLVVNFAASPKEEFISLAALAIETLTEFVAARHVDYRRNPESLRIFSAVMELAFAIVNQLTINQARDPLNKKNNPQILFKLAHTHVIKRPKNMSVYHLYRGQL